MTRALPLRLLFVTLVLSGSAVAAAPCTSLQECEPACAAGKGPACAFLARTLEKQSAGVTDVAQALGTLGRAAQLFQKACDAGATDACGDLARLHLWGSGTRPDAALARKLAERACVGGDGPSCRLWATMLDGAVGGPKDAGKLAEARRRLASGAVRSPFAPPPWPGPAEPVLTITSTPPDQDVVVDGMVAGKSPLTLPVPAGDHLVEVGPKAQKVACARGVPCPVTVDIPPMPQLKVTSTPDGATVKVDGQPRGTTPWSGGLPAGKHALVVELDGHGPVQKTVTLPPTGELLEAVTLKQLVVPLTITSTPTKAILTLDGVMVGKTPWSGTAPVGLRTVELSLEGYQPITDSITVEKGGKQPKPFVLVEVPTQLSVTSEPAGATVELDGTKLGVTPWTGPVKAGPHQLAVVLDGYRDGVEQLTLAPRALTSRSFTLEAKTAAVYIETKPQGAEVEVDGVKRGLTPVTVSLLQGKHVVTLRRAGFEPLRAENVVSSAKPVTWKWDLAVAPDGGSRAAPAPQGAGLSVDALAPFPVADAGAVVVGISFSSPPVVTADTSGGATPPAPPVVVEPGSDADRRRQLADPTISVERKRLLLDSVARTTGLLTEELALVVPADHHASLCLLFRDKVYPARLSVEVTNSFGDKLRGPVELNGEQFGRLPFAGSVPSCITEVTVAVPEEEFRASRTVKLEATKKNDLEFAIPGRGTLATVGATLDIAGSANGWGDGPRTYPSGGVRFDYFGRVSHFSFAVRATGMLTEQLRLPVVPAADVFFGFGGGFGSGVVRGRIMVDLGVWNLMNPTARLTASLQLFTHLVVTMSADLHLFYAGAVPATVRGRYQLISYENFFFPGGTLTVGYGW